MTGAAEAEAAPTPRRPRGNLSALRHRPLAGYIVGNLVSNCGTWIQNIALAVLAYRLTDGNTFWVGVTSFCQFASFIVLAPWSGRAADHFDRRALGIWTSLANTGLCAVLAALSALGHASVAVACVIAFASGALTAFATPALKALVTGLVPADEVGRAVTLDAASYNVARVVGPVLGAAVVAGLGLSWAFLLNGLTFLGPVVGLRWAPRGRPPRDRPRSSLMDTARMVARHPMLLASFAVVAGVSMAGDAVSTLGPELSTDVLGRADTFAGVLVGAFGVGAVTVVALAAPPLRTTPARLAVRCGVMGAGLLGVAATRSLVVLLVALAVAGGGYLAGNTESSTSIQMGVSDADRGRVSALWSVAFLGTRPVASLVLGATAGVAGARVAAVVAVVPLVGALLVVRWASRQAAQGPSGPPGRQPVVS